MLFIWLFVIPMLFSSVYIHADWGNMCLIFIFWPFKIDSELPKDEGVVNKK